MFDFKMSPFIFPSLCQRGNHIHVDTFFHSYLLPFLESTRHCCNKPVLNSISIHLNCCCTCNWSPPSFLLSSLSILSLLFQSSLRLMYQWNTQVSELSKQASHSSRVSACRDNPWFLPIPPTLFQKTSFFTQLSLPGTTTHGCTSPCFPFLHTLHSASIPLSLSRITHLLSLSLSSITHLLSHSSHSPSLTSHSPSSLTLIASHCQEPLPLTYCVSQGASTSSTLRFLPSLLIPSSWVLQPFPSSSHFPFTFMSHCTCPSSFWTQKQMLFPFQWQSKHYRLYLNFLSYPISFPFVWTLDDSYAMYSLSTAILIVVNVFFFFLFFILSDNYTLTQTSQAILWANDHQ